VSVAGGRTTRRRWGIAALVVGLLVVLGAGVRASSLRPSWFDPGDGPPCARRPDGCPADIDSALTGLWWVLAAGGLLALAGLVLAVASLPLLRRTAAPGVHPLTRAVVVGVAGGAVAFPLLTGAFVAVLSGPQLGVAALAVAWLAQAATVAALEVALGGPGPRRAAVTGLVVVGLAAAGTVAFVHRGWPAPVAWVVMDGALLALLSALAGAIGVPRVPGRRAPEAQAVVALVVVLAAVVAGAATLTALDAGPPAVVAKNPALPEPAPLDPPEPAPEPEPQAPPPLPPVEAAVPCAQEDLSFRIAGFDAALGARAASVEARNDGPGPCWVEGVPAVSLVQGGRPLALAVEAGRTPSGEPAAVQRVGLAPGGTALALLTWRTYGGWADAQSPQSVTVALTAGQPPVEVAVPGDHGPAPFDITDGGKWGIAPWAPPGG
jgi:hypothetical protein